MSKLYGEKELDNFCVKTNLEIWENKNSKNYWIKIELPEFVCRCPRSGYPDFATVYIDYIPDKYVVELKALKLYINTFMNRYISHEDSANEIYDTIHKRVEPKEMNLKMDFNPRGNVHTTIEINSKES